MIALSAKLTNGNCVLPVTRHLSTKSQLAVCRWKAFKCEAAAVERFGFALAVSQYSALQIRSICSCKMSGVIGNTGAVKFINWWEKVLTKNHFSRARVGCCFQNDLYWDDWSRMGIFKASKAGSQSNELIVGRLTGVMDLKIFYKGKNRGEGQRNSIVILLVTGAVSVLDS